MKSRAGKLLIASGKLQDPNFARAVVLIIQDDPSGTMGLVLNRPMEMTVQDACEDVLESSCAVEAPLHQGGPCERLLTVLHTRGGYGEIEVCDGVYFTAEKVKILELMTMDGDEAGRTKYFAGYAGWTKDQLDNEIKAGAWLLANADTKHIFDGDDNLWSRMFTELTLGKWVDPKRIPDDPSVN